MQAHCPLYKEYDRLLFLGFIHDCLDKTVGNQRSRRIPIVVLFNMNQVLYHCLRMI